MPTCWGGHKQLCKHGQPVLVSNFLSCYFDVPKTVAGNTFKRLWNTYWIPNTLRTKTIPLENCHQLILLKNCHQLILLKNTTKLSFTEIQNFIIFIEHIIGLSDERSIMWQEKSKQTSPTQLFDTGLTIREAGVGLTRYNGEPNIW